MKDLFEIWPGVLYPERTDILVKKVREISIDRGIPKRTVSGEGNQNHMSINLQNNVILRNFFFSSVVEKKLLITLFFIWETTL